MDSAASLMATVKGPLISVLLCTGISCYAAYFALYLIMLQFAFFSYMCLIFIAHVHSTYSAAYDSFGVARPAGLCTDTSLWMCREGSYRDVLRLCTASVVISSLC